jgi:excisionase family DNA binding protein
VNLSGNTYYKGFNNMIDNTSQTPPSNGTSDKLLTPEQAADLLQVSKRTMYEWLRKGEIPSVKMGERLIRVREKDILTPDVKYYLEQGLQHSQHPSTVEQAAWFFNKAIELNPRYNLAYFHLGTMYYQWSHFYQAVEPLKKAIELNPERTPAYMNLAMNYNYSGNFHGAEELLKKVLELAPDHIEAHYQLGFSLLQQFGKTKEAIKHFRKAVKLHPKHAMAYEFLSHALIDERDFIGARKLLEELKELHPKQAEHLALLIELNEPKR